MLTFILGHIADLCILIMLALGLNLINGFTGMFSLGHHGFFAVGAYASAAFALFVVPDGGAIAWFGSLVVGVFAAGVSGLALGIPCLRLKGDYLAIATLGFAEIIRQIATNTESLGAARGLQDLPELLVARSGDTRTTFFILYTAIIVVATVGTWWLCRNLIRSAQGRALVAIREDEVAAELVGVNLTKSKVMVFVVGAALAGLAGALYAHLKLGVEPKEFNLDKGIYILLFVVLGGSGSLSGTIVAGIVLYILDKIVLNLMPTAIQEWRQVLFALLLIILMIFRPSGMLGNRELSQTRLWQRIFGKKAGAHG
ncbi:MAG TPA: branched-chain amino acid ABC transporter permease [Myxococcota bacterium]|nr:branched-chain amino acid ABC transporter permease [Myxococcota bacterium]